MAGRPQQACEDLTGKRFGRWLVTKPNRIHRLRAWNCKCDCGNERVVPDYHLKHGQSKSCGCGRGVITHGESKTALEYGIWATMKDRCHNPKNISFGHYGGRGIEVCQRWRESYTAFIEDMGYRPSPDHSIDRLDNNKGYFKENCDWRKLEDQLNNKRTNHWIEIDGERKTIAQWTRHVKLGKNTIGDRLKRGWSERDAVLGKGSKPNE